MFYNNTYATRRRKLEKELNQLNPGELEKLTLMENLLATKALDKIERKLRLERPRIVYKFCISSPLLKSICEEEGAAHTESWASFLQKAKYPGFKIISVNKEEEISILDQYLGAYFLTHYKELEDKAQLAGMISLDKACEFGIFDALKKRIELNLEKIKDGATEDHDRRTAKALLLNDLERIGNLYWSLGYLHAAFILLDLGNFYANKNTREVLPTSTSFYKEAAAYFLKAKDLALYHPAENNKIINAICQEELMKVFGFDDWKSAENYLFKHIPVE